MSGAQKVFPERKGVIYIVFQDNLILDPNLAIENGPIANTPNPMIAVSRIHDVWRPKTFSRAQRGNLYLFYWTSWINVDLGSMASHTPAQRFSGQKKFRHDGDSIF